MKISVIVVTFNRPAAIKRFVASVREYHPELQIYVADQSTRTPEMELFYETFNVDVSWVGYDVGVSYSRNVLARKVTTPYFVLCDDDFVIANETSFDGAVAILESSPSIGVVGGKLIDTDGKRSWDRHWENYFQYDKTNRILFAIPVRRALPIERQLNGIKYYRCDAVLNWAVMRVDMFLNGVAWDERFKSNGEHEDFYLNLKQNFHYDVMYIPDMVAVHHHIGTEDYEKYRDRSDGWELFLRKWDLEQMVEIGFGVRHRTDVNVLHAEKEFLAGAAGQDASLSQEAPHQKLLAEPIPERASFQEQPGCDFLIDKNGKFLALLTSQIACPDQRLQEDSRLWDKEFGKKATLRFDAKGRKLRIDRRIRRFLTEQLRQLRATR